MAVCSTACGRMADVAARAADQRQDDEFVRIVLALGHRDPDSLDFYAGPRSWLEQAREEDAPLGEVRRRAAALKGPRYDSELKAVIARIDVLAGRRDRFDDEARLLFGVDAGSRDRSAFGQVRREIDALLPGSGTLAQRYAAFERRFIVPPDRLDRVLTRAIDECRLLARRHLDLPKDEAVTIAYVRGMPWSAFTRYRGQGRSATEINLDFEYTVDRVLELACHETYPGHHAINVLTDPRVQPMYSPHSLRSEGAATYAVELAFPDDRRLAFECDQLFPLAGLPADDAERYVRVARLVDRLRWLQVDVARRYLDGELEFVRAADALESEALMPRPAAEAMLTFFNEFRTYAVTYTVGRDLVADAVGVHGANESARWRAYEDWVR